MHVLVTGGAGYVGSRLLPSLVTSGHQVRVLDTLYFGDGGMRPLVEDGSVELFVGDLRDRDVVVRALAGCDALVHLAAISNDPSAELDEQLTRSINRDATLDLFAAATEGGTARIVNASTATVYGIQHDPDVHEGCSIRPITAYGRFKAETEAVALGLDRPDGPVVTSLRAATVCGTSGRLRLDLSVNMLTAHAVARGRIRVFGGAQLRPNVHIDDLVRAYGLLLEAPAELVRGRAFNVGFENISILELAERIRRVLDRDIEIEVLPVHDERSYYLTSARIRDELGFEPRKGIDDAIREVADTIDDGTVGDIDDPQYTNVARMRSILGAGDPSPEAAR